MSDGFLLTGFSSKSDTGSPLRFELLDRESDGAGRGRPTRSGGNQDAVGSRSRSLGSGSGSGSAASSAIAGRTATPGEATEEAGR